MELFGHGVKNPDCGVTGNSPPQLSWGAANGRRPPSPLARLHEPLGLAVKAGPRLPRPLALAAAWGQSGGGGQKRRS